MKDHEWKHLVRSQYNSKLGLNKKNAHEKIIDVKILLQSKVHLEHYVNLTIEKFFSAPETMNLP